MVVKRKRRVSQRTKGARERQGNGEAQPANENPPRTPPCGKKRRVGDVVPVSKLISVCSAENNSSGGHPDKPHIDGNEPHGRSGSNIGPGGGRVRTPPISRRQLHPVQVPVSGTMQKTSVHRHAGQRPRERTAETIPDTGSDDREVYVVQQQPLEQSAFYRRYISTDNGEGHSPPSVARRVFSPISAGNTDDGIQASGNQASDDERDMVIPEATVRTGAFCVPDSERLDNDVVGGLVVTRDMLSSFFQEMMGKMTTEMKGLHSLICDKFHALETSHVTVLQQMKDLRAVSSSTRTMNCAQSRPTPLAKYEAKLDTATPHGEWVFDAETICKVLSVNFCMFVVSLAGESGETLDNISLAMRATLFGLLPSQKRAAFSSGVGRSHSTFRFKVVLNILFNVQRNAFKRFVPPDISNEDGDTHFVGVLNGSGHCQPNVDGAHVIGPDNAVLQIKQPDWLKPAFIRKRHVEEARARVESNMGGLCGVDEDPVATGKGRRSWISVKDVPDSQDVARYGALKVYRIVTTGLYHAREKARWVLFEELTYFMTDWEIDEVDVDQRTLNVKWNDVVLDLSEADISEVPQCATRRVGIEKADEQNRCTLAQFLSSRKEMVLFVSHDVKVRMNGSSVRQRRAFQSRELKRAINLIDVAAKFCVVFTQQSVGEFSHLPFLGSHADSLKSIYAVALMLRRMVKAFMEKFVVNGSYDQPSDQSPPRLESHNMALEHLLPAASVRKRLLLSRCLRLGIDDYEKMNMRSAEGSTQRGSCQSTETEEDRIDTGDDGVMYL